MRKMGHQRPLIITDKGLVKAGLIKKITDILDEAKMSYHIFDEIEPNPRDMTVQKRCV